MKSVVGPKALHLRFPRNTKHEDLGLGRGGAVVGHPPTAPLRAAARAAGRLRGPGARAAEGSDGLGEAGSSALQPADLHAGGKSEK